VNGSREIPPTEGAVLTANMVRSSATGAGASSWGWRRKTLEEPCLRHRESHASPQSAMCAVGGLVRASMVRRPRTHILVSVGDRRSAVVTAAGSMGSQPGNGNYFRIARFIGSQEWRRWADWASSILLVRTDAPVLNLQLAQCYLHESA
jgi:hypothetical protein